MAKKKTTKKAAKKAVKKIAKKAVTKKAASKKVNKQAKTVKKVTKEGGEKKVVKATPEKRSKKKTTKKVTKKAGKKVTQTVAKRTTSKQASDADNLIHGITPYKEKARESYMNDNQIEHFRLILMAWKQNLLEEVSKTIHLMQDENINHPDPNDRASQETDMSLELRSRDRERKLLKKIEQTILRLDGGDYGWCERCGIEIGIRRLEARPTAELCVDCKTLNEIKERQMI